MTKKKWSNLNSSLIVSAFQVHAASHDGWCVASQSVVDLVAKDDRSYFNQSDDILLDG